MNTNASIKWLAAMAAALGALALAAVTPVQAKEVCFTDWSDAAVAVKKHGLVPVERIGMMAKRSNGSRLVKIELCKVADGYIYKMVMRGPDGRLKRLKVNAKQPFARGAMVQ